MDFEAPYKPGRTLKLSEFIKVAKENKARFCSAENLTSLRPGKNEMIIDQQTLEKHYWKWMQDPYAVKEIEFGDSLAEAEGEQYVLL
jgi:hypothetical protein